MARNAIGFNQDALRMAAGTGETHSQTRPSVLKLVIAGGLSAVVVASLVLAAVNLDLEGFRIELQPGFLALATGLFAVLALFETLRLSALARFEASARLKAWGINAAAMALAQAPLGVFGAEAYRANAYVRRGEQLPEVLAAILVARALGLACMLVLIAVAAGFLADQVSSSVRTLFAASAGLGLMVILAGPSLLRRWRFERGEGRFAAFAKALADLSTRQLLWATLWSFGVVLVRALALWACAIGLGAPITVAFSVFAAAAGFFLSLIPFFSGIVGVREGGIAGVLLLAGLPLAAGILIGFALRVGSVAGALLGMAISHLINERPRP